MKEQMIFVGSYTGEETEYIPGISVYCLEKDRLSLKQQVFGLSNASYLALGEDGKSLYAVMEDMIYRGLPGGGAAAFSLDESGVLKQINEVPVQGTLPCHLLTFQKKALFTANYQNGSLSAFLLRADGGIGAQTDYILHEGSGAHPERQEASHIHFAGYDWEKKGIYFVELGQDALFYYRLSEEDGALSRDQSGDILLPPGVGPRHFVVGEDGIYYVICELSSEMIAVKREKGGFRILQRITTLGEKNVESFCAAVKFSPDGRYLYASNRGEDSIAVFAVEKGETPLRLIQVCKTEGKAPRDFLPLKNHLIAANQNSDSLVLFGRDEETGRIGRALDCVRCHAPVCVISNDAI